MSWFSVQIRLKFSPFLLSFLCQGERERREGERERATEGWYKRGTEREGDGESKRKREKEGGKSVK